MRIIGALLIIAGLGLAFGYPIYVTDFSGTEIARARVFDRNDGGWQNGFKPARVELLPRYSPMRIRIEGEVLAGEYNLENTLPLTVELTGPEGPVVSGPLAVGTGEDHSSSGARPRRINRMVPEFGIIAAGEHLLSVKLETGRDIGLSWLDAIFLANVDVPQGDYRNVGLAIAGAGVLLFAAGGRRRRGGGKGGGPAPKPGIRWGRQ